MRKHKHQWGEWYRIHIRFRGGLVEGYARSCMNRPDGMGCIVYQTAHDLKPVRLKTVGSKAGKG